MKQSDIPPHPRKEPRIPGEAQLLHLREVFHDCADFIEAPLCLCGDENKPLRMVYLLGMVRNERVNDYILDPLARSELLLGHPISKAMDLMCHGVLYNMSVARKYTMEEVVLDLLSGAVLLIFPDQRGMLSCIVPTEEKRSVSPSENEPVTKAARDSFVESLPTNTATIRRRLRTPDMRLREEVVGRQSLTRVHVVYLEGICDPKLPEEALKRLRSMDIDALLESATLEEYLKDTLKTPFPLLSHTERPDRFSAGLVEGRCGILVDGLPLGYLLPATLGQLMKANDDRAKGWMEVSFLRVLRYVCMLIALFLPALYLAAVNFHPEMLPAALTRSIIAAKQEVPFSTIFEVLLLLISFEVLQEASLRLPPAIGTTLSILGGLVVGTAAVQAKLISPAVLIVVATAGIAGFTAPNRDFAGAIQLWRLGFVLAAALLGLYGIVLALVLLIYHLAGLESFGVPFLSPFAACGGNGDDGLVRLALPWSKLRERALKTPNRRNQK